MNRHRLSIKTDAKVVFMVLSSLAFPKPNPRIASFPETKSTNRWRSRNQIHEL